MQSSKCAASCFPLHAPGMCYLRVRLLALIQKSSKVAMDLYMHAVHSFLCSIPSPQAPSNGRRCSFLSHRVNQVVLLSTFYHDLPRYRNVENLSVMTRQAASSSTVKTSISPGRGPLPCEISAEYSLTADGTTDMNTKHECQPICRQMIWSFRICLLLVRQLYALMQPGSL